jgi:nucleotide-binding universal stress UspA family protein
MYKTILVHVDAGDAGSAGRVQLAAQLAHDCGATLVGLAAALPEPTIELLASGGAAIAAGVLVDEHDDLVAQFAAGKAEFTRLTADTGLSTQWRTIVDFPSIGIEAIAGRADLIVVGPSGASSASNGYFDYGDLVMRAGRPVLSVPHGVSTLSHMSAVVAWRNTAEARRAVSDALPLLTLYAETTLVHVLEAGELRDESLEDARDFLSGHCIVATTKVLTAEHGGPGVTIANFVRAADADLVVAGAYGHTRVREWIFGGVTRQLFQNGRVACMLSR